MYQIARLVYWLLGWKWTSVVPADLRKFLIIAVPHTSNWDFFYAFWAFKLMRVPMRFTIKDSMMRFPLNLFFGTVGGIAINRRPRAAGEERPNMVYSMAQLYREHDEIAVCVTPEATRALRSKWKSGFYYIALNAGVPIGLAYCDYTKKEAGIGKIIYPSGDMDKDMREIMAFYKPLINKGKYPELSSIDMDYV